MNKRIVYIKIKSLVILLSAGVISCSFSNTGLDADFSTAAKPSLSSTQNKNIIIGINDPHFVYRLKNSGGAVTNCQITPALSSDFNVEQGDNTCYLFGTPTKTQPTTHYRVTGSNSLGQSYVDISLTVTESTPETRAPQFAEMFNDLLFSTRGEYMQRLTNIGGKITSCSATPQLPEGIKTSVDSTGDCILGGFPQQVSPKTKYTITGANSAGSDSVDIFLTVTKEPQANNFNLKNSVER